MMWKMVLESEGMLESPDSGKIIGMSKIELVCAPTRLGLPNLTEFCCGDRCMMSALVDLMRVLRLGSGDKFYDEFCFDQIQRSLAYSHETLHSLHEQFMCSIGMLPGFAEQKNYRGFVGHYVRETLWGDAYRLWLSLRAGYKVKFVEV